MTIAKFIETSLSAPVNLPKTSQQETQKKQTTLAADNADKFDPDTAAYNKNYQNASNKTEYVPVKSYKGGALQMKNALVQDYVNYTFGTMSGVADNPQLGQQLGKIGYTPQPFAQKAYDAAEATSEKYEDYWGSDAVSERIFTFAKTLANGNDELFDKMKNAFFKGFKLAEGAKKDGLPEICYETKDKVLSLFDKWEEDIKNKNKPETAEKSDNSKQPEQKEPEKTESK